MKRQISFIFFLFFHANLFASDTLIVIFNQADKRQTISPNSEFIIASRFVKTGPLPDSVSYKVVFIPINCDDTNGSLKYIKDTCFMLTKKKLNSFTKSKILHLSNVQTIYDFERLRSNTVYDKVYLVNEQSCVSGRLIAIRVNFLFVEPILNSKTSF